MKQRSLCSPRAGKWATFQFPIGGKGDPDLLPPHSTRFCRTPIRGSNQILIFGDDDLARCGYANRNPPDSRNHFRGSPDRPRSRFIPLFSVCPEDRVCLQRVCENWRALSTTLRTAEIAANAGGQCGPVGCRSRFWNRADLPAPLSWAIASSLPLAEGGIVAQSQGTSLLASGGRQRPLILCPSRTPLAGHSDTDRPAAGFRPEFAGGGPTGQRLLRRLRRYAEWLRDRGRLAIRSEHGHGSGRGNEPDSILAIDEHAAGVLGWATDTSTYTSYAIGGQNNNGTPLATVEAYNPTANTWTYVAPLPQTLYSESALSDGAGHIFTFGGVGADNSITSNVYRYTISTNTWDQVASMPVGLRDGVPYRRTASSTYWAVQTRLGRPRRWKATTWQPTPGRCNRRSRKLSGRRARRSIPWAELKSLAVSTSTAMQRVRLSSAKNWRSPI